MVMVSASPIWPDGVGGQYHNTDADDRAALWQSLGARQGMLSGGALSSVPGSLAVTVAAFRAAVEERDASGNGLRRGYHAWSDADTTVVFDPPSAQARNDAVVLAVADTSAGAGAFGPGVSEAGGQLVVVPGVSGTTTPRLDSDVQAFVGSGGWFRLADVPVNPGDTEINTAVWSLADVDVSEPLVQMVLTEVVLNNQSTNTVDVTWPVPFGDDNVFVSATPSQRVQINTVGAPTATGVTLRANTNDGSNQSFTCTLWVTARGKRP